MKNYPRSFLPSVLLIALALLAGACSPEAKKARVLESADQHYTAGDFDRAEVEYLNVLRLEPQNGRAIGRLGLIYTEQGRATRAIAYLMRGHELLPNDLDVRLRLGQLYFATGKISDARAEAEFILNRRPTDPDAPSLLIATLSKPEEAPALRQRLLNLPAPAPGSAPVLTALASLELRLGRTEEAEVLLQRAMLADASFGSLYSLQAAVQIAKKNLPAADEAFKQAAALSPPRSPRRIQYAQFKIRLGELAAGIKLLEEITQKNPDYVPAWVALAEIHLAQNKTKETETFINRALARDPQNLEAMILQGRLYNQKGEFEKARGVFEKLVASYPRLPLIHQELGRTYANVGDINKAINSLNQSLALAPNSPEAALLLARLNSRKGDHNTAIALLRKTLEQQPGLAQAQFLLAEAYRNQGNFESWTLGKAGREQPPGPAFEGSYACSTKQTRWRPGSV
jgi:tetratricopeptide (TPR) repeat protein